MTLLTLQEHDDDDDDDDEQPLDEMESQAVRI